MNKCINDITILLRSYMAAKPKISRSGTASLSQPMNSSPFWIQRWLCILVLYSSTACPKKKLYVLVFSSTCLYRDKFEECSDIVKFTTIYVIISWRDVTCLTCLCCTSPILQVAEKINQYIMPLATKTVFSEVFRTYNLNFALETLCTGCRDLPVILVYSIFCLLSAASCCKQV